MRVLQINNFHFIKGGADRVYLNTCRLLEVNGHTVINFSSINNENNESGYSKHFVSFKDNRRSNLVGKIGGVKDYLYNNSAKKNLEELIRESKPDIAHLHLFYGGITASVLKTLKELHIPIVMTVHDYRLLCPANAFLDNMNLICEKCRNKFYLYCSIKRCLENDFFYSSVLTMEAYLRKYFIDPLDYIDHFIFVSKFSQQKHIQFNNKFKEKSSLLYNFTFLPAEPAITNQKDKFLFFGRLSREKGLLTLLEAFKESSGKLHIAGSGPLERYVKEAMVNNLNIENHGHCSGSKLEDLIRNSAFIIVPSEWYENNPMTVIEAFAHGKPVIGSDIGGIPETVIDNKTGFLHQSRDVKDLANCLIKAGSMSIDEYSKMSKSARDFAEANFSPESHYAKLIQIYSKIM